MGDVFVSTSNIYSELRYKKSYPFRGVVLFVVSLFDKDVVINWHKL